MEDYNRLSIEYNVDAHNAHTQILPLCTHIHGDLIKKHWSRRLQQTYVSNEVTTGVSSSTRTSRTTESTKPLNLEIFVLTGSRTWNLDATEALVTTHPFAVFLTVVGALASAGFPISFIFLSSLFQPGELNQLAILPIFSSCAITKFCYTIISKIFQNYTKLICRGI